MSDRMNELDVTLVWSSQVVSFRRAVRLYQGRGWDLKTVYVESGITYATMTRPKRIY